MAWKHNPPKYSDSSTENTSTVKMTAHSIDILNSVTTQLTTISKDLATIKIQDSERTKQLSEAHDAFVDIVDNLFARLEERLKLRRRGLKFLDRTVHVAKLNIAMVLEDLNGNSKAVQKPEVLKMDDLPAISPTPCLSTIWGPPALPGPETGAIPKAGPSKLNAEARPFHMTPKADPRQEQKLNSFVNGLGLDLDEVNQDPQLRRDLDYSMRASEAMEPQVPPDGAEKTTAQ